MSVKPFLSGFVGGAFWAFLFKLLFSFSGFIAGVLLSRLLPVSDVGHYFLLISAVSVASAVALFGLNFSLVKLVVDAAQQREKNEVRQVAVDSLVVISVLSIAVSILGWVVFDEQLHGIFGGQVGSFFVVFIALMILCGALLSAVAEIFRGLQDIFYASLFPFLPGALFVTGLCLYWLGFAHGEIAVVVELSVLAIAISCFLGWATLLWRLRGVGAGTRSIRRLMMVSAPLWITNLMLIVLMQVDVWILGLQGDSAVVGVYGAASRLTQFVTFPMTVINSVLIPIIGEIYSKGDYTKLERVLRATAAVAFIPAMSCFLFFLFCGGWVLAFVYGPEYVSGYGVLVLLSLGQLIGIACGSSAYTLIMAGKQKAVMLVTTVFGSLTVALSFAVVAEYGAIGVAAATALGLALQCIAMWGWVRLTCGVWTHPLWALILRPYKIRAYF